MKRYIASVFALAVLAFVVGCAQLGVTAPQSFNEKAYAAALSIDSIQKNADALLKAGKISATDAENVLKATDVATEGIKVARSYASTAPTTANSRLDAAVMGLTALTTYLNAQGGK
jgi:hypothetical protein